MFDFPDTVESVDAVPEAFRNVYEEAGEEGGLRLIPAILKRVEAKSELTSGLEKERKRAQNLKRELNGFRDVADTPDALIEHPPIKTREHEEKISELQSLVDEKGDAATKFEKLKTDLQDSHKKLQADLQAAHEQAISEKDQELAGMRSSLDKYLIDTAALTTLQDDRLKGNPTLLLPHIREHSRVFNENGAYVVRIIDKDGDPRGDGKGGFMDIPGFVTELRSKDEFAQAFDGNLPSGGGTPPSGGGGRGSVNYSLNDWRQKVSEAKSEERQKIPCTLSIPVVIALF